MAASEQGMQTVVFSDTQEKNGYDQHVTLGSPRDSDAGSSHKQGQPKAMDEYTSSINQTLMINVEELLEEE